MTSIFCCIPISTWTFLLLMLFCWLREVHMLSLPQPTLFAPRRIRVAVDFAPRLIGLAYSDLLGQVHPHSTFRNQPNQIYVAQHILDFAVQKSAIEVILGLPLDVDGKVGYDVSNFNGKLCLNFSRVLAAIAKHQFADKIKVKLFDERYSTREACIKRDNGIFGSKDSVAAACILERYVEDKGVGAMDAIPCCFPIPPDVANFDYEIVKTHIRELYESEENEYHSKPKKLMKHQMSPHKNTPFRRKKKPFR